MNQKKKNKTIPKKKNKKTTIPKKKNKKTNPKRKRKNFPPLHLQMLQIQCLERTYINKNPITIAAATGFRSAFHIMVARDFNGDLELELNEDWLLQSK
ncbi:hypothetical protein P8452_67963 [Trifolium repens]|jgi:hypothetical protein|nr:hypothetical protein QL285_089934 [Trifolium repens]WJX85525.1 hypothetical protein P8452_67963 [Trifolium repens]